MSGPPAYVLGIDPGFANFGYALASIVSGRFVFQRIGVLHTWKSEKKLKVLAASDNVRRTRELHDELTGLCSGLNIVAFTAESMSFPPNASSAAKMSLAWGVICSVANQLGRIPIAEASPIQIKTAVTKRRTASKLQVQQALEALDPVLFGAFTKSAPKGDHEHAFDAAGSVLACSGNDAIALALRCL